MGNRLTQRIYTCDICGDTPEDGEYMWHMGSEKWCEKCCNEENVNDEPKTKTDENKKGN